MVDGAIQTTPYDRAASFDAKLFEVSSIYDVAKLLGKVLEPDPHSFLIRGVPKQGEGLKNVRRKKSDNGGIFEPSPGHCWLPIDLDDLESPITNAVTTDDNGVVTGIVDPDAYVRSVIATHLPDYLHDATCYYQFTSSAGVKGWDKARLRLHFWLSEPIADSVLHDVWANHHVKCVDRAIYRDVQPIYTAAPKFVGMSDPCSGWRSGLIEGSSPTVTITPAHLVEPADVIAKRQKDAKRLERQKRTTFNQSRLERYLYAAVDWCADELSGLLEGRYETLRAQSRRLAGYAHHLGLGSAGYLDYLQSAMMNASVANGAASKHGNMASAIQNAIADGSGKPLALPETFEADDKADKPRQGLEPSKTDYEKFAAERGHQYNRVDAGYMSDGVNIDDLPKDATIVNIGEQGCGKSELNKRTVWGDTSLLSIAHLKGLAENAASELENETKCYTNVPHAERHAVGRLSICLDSLLSLAHKGVLKPYDTVVIDEPEQLLTRLTQDKNIANKPGVFEVLRFFVSTAGRLITSDADMSELTLDFIESLRPDKPVVINESTSKPVVGRKMDILPDSGSLDKRLMERVGDGKRCYVAANSRKRLKRIAARITKRYPDKKLLIVSSDTSGNPDVIAWLNDPSVESFKYDVVLASPSAGTNISIKGDAFNFVAGYFQPDINTPHDCKQAARRVRNEVEMAIWIGDSKRRYETDKDKLRQQWIKTPAHKKDAETFTADGRAVPISEFYEQLWLKATSARHDKMNDFRDTLIGLFRDAGFVLDSQDGADDAKQQRDETREAGDTDRKTELVEAVLNAPGDDEVAELERKERLTSDERLALEGYALRHFYRADDPDLTDTEVVGLVERDRDGRLRTEVNALEIASESEDKAIKRQQRAAKDDSGVLLFRPDVRNVSLERNYYRRALQAANVEPDELSTTLEPYDSDSPGAVSFKQWCVDNSNALAGFTKVNPADTAAKMVGIALKRLGLKSKRRKQNKAYVRVIDPDSLAAMVGIVEKRAELWQGYQPSKMYEKVHTLSISKQNITKGVHPKAPADDVIHPHPFIGYLYDLVKRGDSLISPMANDYRWQLEHLGVPIPGELLPPHHKAVRVPKSAGAGAAL